MAFFLHPINNTAMNKHYMQLALEQAQLAEKAGEVPVGAILVTYVTILHTKIIASLLFSLLKTPKVV